MQITIISADTMLDNTHEYVIADADPGDFTITFPLARCSPRPCYHIAAKSMTGIINLQCTRPEDSFGLEGLWALGDIGNNYVAPGTFMTFTADRANNRWLITSIGLAV